MDNIINSPERTKKRRKKNGLKLKFGINFDQYEAMLKEQDYLCCICGNKDRCGRDLAVDHCHETNKVRGLLCTECNTGLGLFGDSKELLKNAINYLDRNYTVPDIECSLGIIDRDNAKGWKLLILTPDGKFPSATHAGRHYGVNATTIRSWCLQDSKYKREGFSCKKIFASINEIKELIKDERI